MNPEQITNYGGHGSAMVSSGELRVGQVITVLFAITLASASIGRLLGQVEKLAKATASARKLFQVIERIPSIDSLSTEGIVFNQMKQKIEFKDVSFKYESRQEGRI